MAESTAENHAALLDAWERPIRRLWAALFVDTSLDGPGLSAIDRLASQETAYDEMDAVFASRDELRRLKQDMDIALNAVPLREVFAGPLAYRARELARNYAMARAAFDYQAVLASNCMCISSVQSLFRDPSGGDADMTIQRLYGLAARLDRSSSREDRKEGLWHLLRGILRNYDTYAGKPREYFISALKRESRRHSREREQEDTDRLGLTPKESRRLPTEELEQRRAWNESATDSEIAPQPGPSAEEILIAAAEAREREQVIETFAAGLPPDQRALFERMRSAGLGWTEARKQLRLPQSTENALRNRVDRWAKRLQATAS